jgi:hypothetical protein
MHPLLEAYKRHTESEDHRQQAFNPLRLFIAPLDNPSNIMSIHWRGLESAMKELGRPIDYNTLPEVFFGGWEKGDPTGELKALFQEVVNGPLTKELDEYM